MSGQHEEAIHQIGGQEVVEVEEKKKESMPEEPHWSILSEFEKRAYAYASSIAALASPVSSTIYYPAMNILAADLNTSLTNINLTITTYMVLFLRLVLNNILTFILRSFKL